MYPHAPHFSVAPSHVRARGTIDNGALWQRGQTRFRLARALKYGDNSTGYDPLSFGA